MIGVSVPQADWPVVEEFFQLFKTPWEPAVASRRYEAVLTTERGVGSIRSDVLLAYGAELDPIDRDAGVDAELVNGPADVEWAGRTFPIYGRAALFQGQRSGELAQVVGKTIQYRAPSSGECVVRRIGYDLFDEVRFLLSEGQPPVNALTPTLELHIALLRSLLLESGVAFVEIPPRPEGREFICCLTHDVDFFGIRRHWFDRTIGGFVVRASVGTVAAAVRGTRTWGDVWRNWTALATLPLVFLGLKRDFWQPFDDYAKAEAGRPSTFFLVPFKGRAGVAPDGTVDGKRAVSYGLAEITPEAKAASARGAELAIHGIDAWHDSAAGRAELNELTAATGARAPGIRMHWLYFGAEAPKQLEAAGFAYDSTWGYNNAVGYRAGTSQAFRLNATADLMELPMSIMDSALFYPDRMGLEPEAALSLCRRLVANARQYGGTVVVNWHCRSLAPERLWGGFYQQLLAEIGDSGRVWFATAADAVNWFRWRRSIRFERTDGEFGIAITAPSISGATGGVIDVYRPGRQDGAERLTFDGRQPLTL